VGEGSDSSGFQFRRWCFVSKLVGLWVVLWGRERARQGKAREEKKKEGTEYKNPDRETEKMHRDDGRGLGMGCGDGLCIKEESCFWDGD